MQESGQSVINIVQETLTLYIMFPKLLWLAKNKLYTAQVSFYLSCNADQELTRKQNVTVISGAITSLRRTSEKRGTKMARERL
jgi:hypothetical protein